VKIDGDGGRERERERESWGKEGTMLNICHRLSPRDTDIKGESERTGD